MCRRGWTQKMGRSLRGEGWEARKTKVSRGGWAGGIPICRDYAGSPGRTSTGFVRVGTGCETRDSIGQSDDTFPFAKIDTGGIATAAARAPSAKGGSLDQSKTVAGDGPPRIFHRTVRNRSNSIRRFSIDLGRRMRLSDWLSCLHVPSNDPWCRIFRFSSIRVGSESPKLTPKPNLTFARINREVNSSWTLEGSPILVGI